MKKFLCKTSIFLGIAALLLILFHMLLMTSRARMLKVPDGVSTVFLGNSTVEVGINDSLIPGTYNFARSAETLEMVYARLKLLKRYNPGIDTVIVSLDDAILTSDIYISHGSPKAVMLDSFTAKDWMMDFNYYAVETDKQFVSTLYHFYNVAPMLRQALRPDWEDNYMGGFLPLHRSNLDVEIEKYENGEDIVGIDNTVFPSICRYYLDKIVDFCRKKDLTLIFLSMPKHRYFGTYDAYRQIHGRSYSDIPLIDCMDMELPDSCYADVAHLNYIGADTFSLYLRDRLHNRTR